VVVRMDSLELSRTEVSEMELPSLPTIVHLDGEPYINRLGKIPHLPKAAGVEQTDRLD